MKNLIVCCVLFVLTACVQSTSLPQDPMIKRYQLDNGLTVILIKISYP